MTMTNLGHQKLSDPILYVMAGDVNAETDVDDELEQCVLDSAETIYRQMPDALPPEVLAEEIRAKRALLIVLECTDGQSIGGVAIGTRRYECRGDGFHMMTLKLAIQ